MIARVIVHASDDVVKELPNPLAAAEMSLEQNYNHIDGAINNGGDKPSVLAQLREAKKAPPAPHKEKAERGKGEPEL
jgi:hypothetical protein